MRSSLRFCRNQCTPPAGPRQGREVAMLGPSATSTRPTTQGYWSDPSACKPGAETGRQNYCPPPCRHLRPSRLQTNSSMCDPRSKLLPNWGRPDKALTSRPSIRLPSCALLGPLHHLHRRSPCRGVCSTCSSRPGQVRRGSSHHSGRRILPSEGPAADQAPACRGG